jgi:ferredoxin
MRVVADHDLCSGHARCHATAPGIFDLDEIGYVVLTSPDVADGGEDDARRGAAACPERALRIEA